MFWLLYYWKKRLKGAGMNDYFSSEIWTFVHHLKSFHHIILNKEVSIEIPPLKVQTGCFGFFNTERKGNRTAGMNGTR